MTGINLDVLDGLDGLDGPGQSGKPLSLALDIVHEDPNQPRHEFDDVLELAASIAEVGVKVPITVRTHPTIPGHYMIKFGARRRRAAVSAGLTHIPAWLDEVESDFEQVVENLQRADLTALELAQFMADKVAGGMKPAAVGKKLGIGRPAVVKYLALANPPPEIEAVYASGRTTSPDTIFDLRTVFTRYPDETRAWLAEDHEVTRRSVEALRQRLDEGNAQPVLPSKAPAKRRAVPDADPSEIKRPIVAVKVGERFGMLVLTRRAADDSHVLIKWHDTAKIEEVSPGDVHVLRVDDARRYEPINRGLAQGEGSDEG